MNQLDGLRRYIEAATTLTSITRARAEELVRDLVASGELERGRAQDWIEDLVKRSREASEALVSTVSSEVDRQLGERGLKNFDLDDLAQRVAAIITRAGNAGRTATSQRSRHESEDGAATKKTPSAKTPSAKSGSAKSDGKSSTGKSSTKKKDGAQASGAKSSAKNGGKGSKKTESRKTESKKVTTLSPPDQTSGTAT